jgi:flavin reductase
MSAPQTSAYRDAMARLGAAVNVITTGTLENPVGFTASAVCSVTDTPPTLLVCLNRASRVREFFHVGAPLCVNVLSASQEELSGHFASANSMEERFALGHWDTLSTGAPALKEAVATFDCLISQIVCCSALYRPYVPTTRPTVWPISDAPTTLSKAFCPERQPLQKHRP